MSNNKMKGLLKGLRYISQIFENEKEPEMQIGFPTDVKHVAHIGWDGPSVNSPSWMNEFKPSGPGGGGGGGSANGEVNDDGSEKYTSEDSKRSSRQGGSMDRDLPELPKSSRRNSSTGSESPIREKADKPKQSRRSSRNANKDLPEGTKVTRHQKVPSQGGSGDSSNQPELPKKSRRKKSKDSSSRLRSKAQANDSDVGSDCGSVSKSLNSGEFEPSRLSSLEAGEETMTIS